MTQPSGGRRRAARRSLLPGVPGIPAAGARRRSVRSRHTTPAARLLLAALGLLGVAALVAVAVLWPDRSGVQALQRKAEFAPTGTTYVEARLTERTDTTADGQQGSVVVLHDGPDAGRHVTVTLPRADQRSALGAGDTVVLARTPAASDAAATYTFFAVSRGPSLWLLAALFVVVLVAVARWRGVMALVGLAVAGAMLWWFVVPAMLVGHHPALVALAGAAVILFVVLYTTHGVRPTTSAALAGTLGGVGITVGLATWAVHATRLNGVTGDAGSALLSYAPDVAFPGLLVAGVVIAGLGVLNDVTITQASAVYELRAASPTARRVDVLGAAMRIGRDHIASTVYTIVFAYAGTALLTLMVIRLYAQPAGLLISTEDLAEEVVRTLVSSVGLILAVPLTTVIAALVADTAGDSHGHSHGHAHGRAQGHEPTRLA